MKKYLVREVLELEIEADSEKEAIDKFDRSEAPGEMDVIKLNSEED